MSREQFFALRNNVHFVDTIKPPEEAKTNRLWKVQPVIDTVRRCHSLPRSFNYYSIDEQMIHFTGCCKLKQYIKGKPRPVGLKHFIMTSASGIVLDLEIYEGATTLLGDKSLGLGPSFILRLTQTLPQGNFVYFNRYFTTIPLLVKLKEKEIEATGTIMVNRIKNVNLKEGRMKRGECHSYVRADEAVVITEWQDSQRVVIASTCAGIEPKCKVQRWCKQKGHYLDVDCPFVIEQYNAKMGGVDIHDQQVECYRMWFRTRKWTFKCLLHFIDLLVVNCRFLYREHCSENQTAKKNIIDLLKFRMSLAEALLSCQDRKRRAEELDDTLSTSTKAKVYKLHPKPGLDKRYDGYDHWPTVYDILSPRTYQYERCNCKVHKMQSVLMSCKRKGLFQIISQNVKQPEP
ncbi:piggyBac transposable element-derived protein 3-like [Schistocerca gregaria]|uniref:piggyBac transposable element-derived protein 3-like n=1 Tax=Schistocerca gregaria TaxID=7010 RepID=UPI00211E65F2|nr:piggyBac transposable element-derived protein 3-like [Schistocerca gregaria]